MTDVLVLCYHAVSERWPAALSVTPAALRSQLELLAARGYHGATFHRAVTGPPHRRTVALTFDDAYRSVATEAAPILSDLGWPATVFVATDHLDEGQPMRWPGIDQWHGGPFEPELAPMSGAQLRGLADQGWEVGSHTRTHSRLTTLDHDALAGELEGSRAAVERIMDRPCSSLAYPYGDHDERVVAAAQEAGYEAAGTLPARFHRAEPLRFPRVGIYHADGVRRFRLKVSPFGRRLRRVAGSLQSGW